jgi:hypothetical protein
MVVPIPTVSYLVVDLGNLTPGPGPGPDLDRVVGTLTVMGASTGDLSRTTVRRRSGKDQKAQRRLANLGTESRRGRERTR